MEIKINIFWFIYFVISWGIIWYIVGYLKDKKSKEEYLKEYLVQIQSLAMKQIQAVSQQTQVLQNITEKNIPEKQEVSESKDVQKYGNRLSEILKLK